MPKDQELTPFEMPEDLPEMTEKQQGFVEFVAGGMSDHDAYLAAYKPRDRRPGKVAWMICQVKARPAVATALRMMRILGASELVEDYTSAKKRHLLNMASLAEEARATGQYSAAITAEKAIGQALGIYVERVQLVDDSSKPTDLVGRIRAELGDEAAEVAAARLGVQAPEQTQPVIVQGEAKRLN